MDGLMVGRIEMKTMFCYPEEFVTLLDYTAHAGQEVEVYAALEASKYEQPFEDDDGFERMFKIRAADGWEGQAFESELPYPPGDNGEFLAYCNRLVEEAANL